MIVASLLLILLAVVLLVIGLAGGSSVLLVVSIAASLLAAVALVVGARQAATDRAAAASRATSRSSAATGFTTWTSPDDGYGAAAAHPPVAEPYTPVGEAYTPVGEPYSPVGESGIPVQYLPPTVDTDGAGRRQPPGPPVDLGPAADATHADEPAAEHIDAADEARLAGLVSTVRVVDGRPRYHLAHCPHLVGREHEPLLVAEAVEFGFTPCAHCAPATTLLAGRIVGDGAGA